MPIIVLVATRPHWVFAVQIQKTLHFQQNYCRERTQRTHRQELKSFVFFCDLLRSLRPIHLRLRRQPRRVFPAWSAEFFFTAIYRNLVQSTSVIPDTKWSVWPIIYSHFDPKCLRLKPFHSAACSRNKRNYLELSWKSTTYAGSVVPLSTSSSLGSFKRRLLSANFYYFWQA